MLPAIEKLVKNLKPKYDDDVIDRLNYAYTSAFFVLLIIVIGAKQYVGEPLQCWIGAESKGTWEKYIENYCFVENTYYVSFDDDRLPAVTEREKYELRYYQWVPVVLIVQLLLFLAPKNFWGAVSWKTGLSVNSLLGGQQSHAERQRKIITHKPGKNDEHSEARLMATHIRGIVGFNNRRNTRLWHMCSPKVRVHYFTSMYMVYKFLNLLNTFFQLYIMNRFLNTAYFLWGFGVLRDLINERDWRASGHFPRVTHCDYMRRDDTSSRPMLFTTQCVLMINMFNEKLYIILWFWFAALTILNIFNLFYWAIISWVDACKVYFIEAQLNFAGAEYDKRDIPDFIKYWISMDGLTALRLISANTGDLTSSEIVAALFHDYCEADEKEKDGKKSVAAKRAKKYASAKFAEELPSKKGNGNPLEQVNYQNGGGPQKVHPAPPPPPPQSHPNHPPQNPNHIPIEENAKVTSAAPLPPKIDPDSKGANAIPGPNGVYPILAHSKKDDTISVD